MQNTLIRKLRIMMKLIVRRYRLAKLASEKADPLSHPEVRRMSLRELDDLPFDRR